MPAVNVLYWLILGDLIKTLTQPLSSVLMSFAEGRTYLTVRSIISVTYVGLAFVLVPYYGVAGVGVAYVAAYIIHFYIMRRIIKKLIVWELSSENIILVTLVIISIVTAMSLSNTDDVSVLSYGLCIFILITWIFFALVKIYESLSAREG
jgi:PST family polysaccharide transporter